MVNKKSSNKARLKRHLRIRKKIKGTAQCPRLSVFRSLKNMYAQLIDDENGVTIVLENGTKVLPDRTLVLADGTEIPMTMTAAQIVELLHPTQSAEG